MGHNFGFWASVRPVRRAYSPAGLRRLHRAILRLPPLSIGYGLDGFKTVNGRRPAA